MVKKLLFLIGVIFLFVVKGFSENAILDLKGELIVKEIKSTSIQIEVSLIENQLHVNFFVCIEKLNIVIENENGLTVYQTTVNTCLTSSIDICIQNLPKGEYVIIFTDDNGGRVEGVFEV